MTCSRFTCIVVLTTILFSSFIFDAKLPLKMRQIFRVRLEKNVQFTCVMKCCSSWKVRRQKESCLKITCGGLRKLIFSKWLRLMCRVTPLPEKLEGFLRITCGWERSYNLWRWIIREEFHEILQDEFSIPIMFFLCLICHSIAAATVGINNQ